MKPTTKKIVIELLEKKRMLLQDVNKKTFKQGIRHHSTAGIIQRITEISEALEDIRNEEV